MAPRLKIGRSGHGDATARTAASTPAAAQRQPLHKGSGERAAGLETQAEGGRGERVSQQRRGSGAGT